MSESWIAQYVIGGLILAPCTLILIASVLIIVWNFIYPLDPIHPEDGMIIESAATAVDYRLLEQALAALEMVRDANRHESQILAVALAALEAAIAKAAGAAR